MRQPSPAPDVEPLAVEIREAAQREPPGALRGWNAALLFECLSYRGDKADALALLDDHVLPNPADPETHTWGATQLPVFAV